ncbi:MAG TPA: hypothetical protein VIV60_19890 [Polyangiaceae bacterium]
MARDIRFQIMIDQELDLELTQQATEIEVSQSIEKPWEFRIRFAVDICDAELKPSRDPRLVPNTKDTLVSVLASVDDKTVCLVQGIITSRQTSAMVGGPGSWVEIFGSDRRAVMHREFKTKLHEGKASEIVEQILKDYGFEAKVDPSTIEYSEDQNMLVQAHSDLDFLDQLAGNNGYYFWIDYDVTTDFLGRVEIKENAHFAASPPRPKDAGPFGALVSLLAPSSPPKLTINTNDGCSSMALFEHKERFEAINRTPTLRRINIDDAQVEDTDIGAPTDDPLGGPPRPAQARTCRVVTAGGIEEAHLRNQNALNDAAWTVDAQAKTTVFALGDIVTPHQLIEVSGAGEDMDGQYLISSVTHHINAADHKMEINLQRNPGGG